jgi:ribonuclease P protein component
MRPHHDYVLVGRRAALTRDFATMLDDLRSALHRLDRQPKPFGGTKAFSSEADAGSREENASKRNVRASGPTSVGTERTRSPN